MLELKFQQQGRRKCHNINKIYLSNLIMENQRLWII